MPKDVKEKLRPYEFFGVEFYGRTVTGKNGRESTAICPYCLSVGDDGSQKDGKFYVNHKTGQYFCHHCGEKGNTTTYLTAMYEDSLRDTTPADFKRLAKARPGCEWMDLRDFGLAQQHKDDFESNWICPITNREGIITNIKWFELKDTGVGAPQNPAGLPTNFYNLQNLEDQGPVYIAEGLWDSIALIGLLRRAKVQASVLGLPAANTYKHEWETILEDREVYLYMDNDTAGTNGTENFEDKMKDKVSMLHLVNWPNSLASGYDLRDYIVDNRRMKPQKVVNLLHKMAPGKSKDEDEISVADIGPPLKRTSFKTILKDYRERYHVDKNFEDAVLVSFATVFASQLPGDPLWQFLVGPPGSGKSLILKSLQSSLLTVFKSRIKATSLISGYQTDDGSDLSLLLRLKDMCLVVKDWTAITSMSFQDQESLYGLMRDIFDGRVDLQFGNQIGARTYENCYFSLLAGVTDVIRTTNRSELGERFLMFQMLDGDYDESRHIRAAIDGAVSEIESEIFLRRAAQGFTQKPFSPDDLCNPPNWVVDRIVELSRLVVLLRADWSRGITGDINYRQTTEKPTRVAKQLLKMAKCIAFVSGRKNVDMEVYRIIEKIGFDSCMGWHTEIVQFLMSRNQVPQTIPEIEDAIGIPRRSLDRRLDAMQMLGIVTRDDARPSEETGRGRRKYTYELTPKVVDLWKTAVKHRTLEDRLTDPKHKRKPKARKKRKHSTNGDQ